MHEEAEIRIWILDIEESIMLIVTSETIKFKLDSKRNCAGIGTSVCERYVSQPGKGDGRRDPEERSTFSEQPHESPGRHPPVGYLLPPVASSF
ncbi:hypothetical protein KM043_014173 [Ampulex compressa]|nr:hypothetical protein KM043_014173 [Ampulex compressa]